MNRRARVGTFLLATWVCLSASYGVSRVAVTPGPEGRHPALVAEYEERRYNGLADALPPGGVVGYVTDNPGSSEAIRSYYLSQYVLAPCVLVAGDRQSLVIVDDSSTRAARPEMVGRRLLRDLGNGVCLFGRRER